MRDRVGVDENGKCPVDRTGVEEVLGMYLLRAVLNTFVSKIKTNYSITLKGLGSSHYNAIFVNLGSRIGFPSNSSCTAIMGAT